MDCTLVPVITVHVKDGFHVGTPAENQGTFLFIWFMELNWWHFKSFINVYFRVRMEKKHPIYRMDSGKKRLENKYFLFFLKHCIKIQLWMLIKEQSINSSMYGQNLEHSQLPGYAACYNISWMFLMRLLAFLADS